MRRTRAVPNRDLVAEEAPPLVPSFFFPLSPLCQVAKLLAIKTEFKEKTGEDYPKPAGYVLRTRRGCLLLAHAPPARANLQAAPSMRRAAHNVRPHRAARAVRCRTNSKKDKKKKKQAPAAEAAPAKATPAATGGGVSPEGQKLLDKGKAQGEVRQPCQACLLWGQHRRARDIPRSLGRVAARDGGHTPRCSRRAAL